MRPLAATFAATLVLSAIVSVARGSMGIHPQAARPPQAGQQQSPIVVAPPVVDLGVVEPGSSSPAKFTIINGGKTPVTVTAGEWYKFSHESSGNQHAAVQQHADPAE